MQLMPVLHQKSKNTAPIQLFDNEANRLLCFTLLVIATPPKIRTDK